MGRNKSLSAENQEGSTSRESTERVLEEYIDPDYEPREEDVYDYAKFLGMDLVKDESLLWIAREYLKKPLPEDWKACCSRGDTDIYYYNFKTGESTWNHPLDNIAKKIFLEEKQKKLTIFTTFAG